MNIVLLKYKDNISTIEKGKFKLYRECSFHVSPLCIDVGPKENFRGSTCLPCDSYKRKLYYLKKKAMKIRTNQRDSNANPENINTNNTSDKNINSVDTSDENMNSV